MFKSFCAWEIPNVLRMADEPTLRQILDIAQATGYPAVQIDIRTVDTLAREKSIHHVKALFAKAHVRAAGWYVGDAWRLDDHEYQRLLDELPQLAQTSRDLGCRTAYIWMPNGSDERNYDDNFAWHVQRLRPIVDILKHQGHRLALEWQGTKSERRGKKYEFIHTLETTRQLIAEIARASHVGLLLDSWHLFTAHDDFDHIKNLTRQVFYVHICDAPHGTCIDELPDLVREAPGATGVIDLVAFLKGLDHIGYQGPIEPSIPFVPKGRPLETDTPPQAAKRNAQYLDDLFKRAGITETQP